MRHVFAAIVVLLAAATPASAQHFHHHGFYGGAGFGGYGYGGGFGFSLAGPHVRFAAQYRGFYSAPVLPYYFGNYGFGPSYGNSLGNSFFLPSPVVQISPVIVIPVVNIGTGNPNPAANRDANLLPPGAKPGEFRVIAPRNANVPAPERPSLPKVRDPHEDRRVIGKTDTPDLEPASEAARQVRLAREAFLHGDYGEAGEHLDRALTAQPNDSKSIFLKSQAQFAAGQYAEAVTSIEQGLKLAPEWPGNRFNSRVLYGRQERFDRQLADLRKALAARPNDASLQFLLAYQLWFGGDRPEATNLFRLLVDRLKDASAVELFLMK